MYIAVRDANYGRVLVVLNAILRGNDGTLCSCPRCFNTVVATALNFMIPHYYTDEKWKDNLGTPWEMVETAVLQAIRENPGH